MRSLAFALALALPLAGSGGCSQPADVGPDATVVDVDAVAEPDATTGAGFGELSGMCGSLLAADFAATTPTLIRATITFARAYVDPDDRPLLTAGGRRLAETPNAGGSSLLSEVFAYEQLARCEEAALVKTETEIVYDTTGKMTDLSIMVDGHKVGVSVTRAVTYPLGGTYSLDTARTLMTRKLEDIQMSTANVSEQDRWTKQVLAMIAWDTATADVVAQAWASLDASVKADTIVVVTESAGDDVFLYSN